MASDEERAAAQPADHAARAAPLRLQGPRSARSSTPTRGTRRSRRCSSATRRTCAASGSRSRSAASTLLRGRAGLPHPPRRVPLPDISLAADEAAVVALAARVWEHASLAEATTEAVRKLSAFGLPVDMSRPRHGPAAAHRRGAVVRRVLGGEPGPHPGGVRVPPRRPGHAHDPSPAAVGRGALLGPLVRRRASTPTAARNGSSGSRACRVRRVARDSRASYDIPAGVDIREMAHRLAPPEPPAEPVTVLVRQDTAGGLRRAAASAETDVPGPDDATRWDRLVLPRGGMALADELLGHGSDVYVESPRRAAQGRRRPAPGRRRGRCRMTPPAPNSAKAQVVRLLTLVPYLHARGLGPGRRGRRRSRRHPRPARQRPQGPVHVRAPRRLSRRPDRRRPRRARGGGGRRGHPGLQRRLPRASAAAVTDRGDRAHRRAAGHAQRCRRRHPRGGRPHALQAGGGGRRAASTRGWTPGRSPSATRERSTAPSSSGPPPSSARSG